jgi:transposase-like protein
MGKHTSYQAAVNAKYFRERFPTEESAREYLEEKRWNGKPVCPFCNSSKVGTVRKSRPGQFRCNNYRCHKEFNVRTKSIFEHSRMDLRDWFLACYYMMKLEGASSIEIADEIGISQKSAWRMCHCIREAMSSSSEGIVLRGIVEIDEAGLGGSECYKHLAKRLFPGGGMGGKIGALCMVERGDHGRAKTIVLPDKLTLNINGKIITTPDTASEILLDAILSHVERGSLVNTDSSRSYKDLRKRYLHWKVNHSMHRYVINLKHAVIKQAHTNTVESRWSVLKTEYRNHRWYSRKHIRCYLGESDFRWNKTRVFAAGKDGVPRFKCRKPTEKGIIYMCHTNKF